MVSLFLLHENSAIDDLPWQVLRLIGLDSDLTSREQFLTEAYSLCKMDHELGCY